MITKKYNVNDYELMKEMTGTMFNGIYFVLDMLVINFGENTTYALHLFTFSRIRSNSENFLIFKGDFHSPYFRELHDPYYYKEIFDLKVELDKNIIHVNELLKNSLVTDVKLLANGDFSIYFDNGLVLDVIVDRKLESFEYYRFFKYDPNLSVIERKTTFINLAFHRKKLITYISYDLPHF
jgi:hypothetical protein